MKHGSQLHYGIYAADANYGDRAGLLRILRNADDMWGLAVKHWELILPAGSAGTHGISEFADLLENV